MTTAIAGFTPTTPADTTSTNTAQNLSGSDFIKLMITQLEQQDPTNPTDSNQILSQLSEISTLQSNTQMQSSLQGLTLQQSIGAGGNLIGKTITGKDANGQDVAGVVSSIAVKNQKVLLEVTSSADNTTQIEVPMENLTTIAQAPAATAASQSSLASLLSSLTGSGGANASTALAAPLTSSGSGANVLGGVIQNVLGTASALTGGGV